MPQGDAKLGQTKKIEQEKEQDQSEREKQERPKQSVDVENPTRQQRSPSR